MEHGLRSLHLLGWQPMPYTIRQRGHLGKQRNKLGTRLVRHQYVFSFIDPLTIYDLTHKALASRWLIASSVGIPTASLLISKRIYHIANITTVQSSRADRRRMVLIDTSIGLGIPIVQVALCELSNG